MFVAIYRTMIFLVKKIPGVAARNDELYKNKRVSPQPQSNERCVSSHAIV